MIDPKEGNPARRRARAMVPAALLLAVGVMAGLCFSGTGLSALRFSGGSSAAFLSAGVGHGRRLQEGGEGAVDAAAAAGDLDGEETPMEIKEEKEEANSDNFDSEEEAAIATVEQEEAEEIEEELEEAKEISVGPVDIEKDFEAVNTKELDEDALFALQEMKMRLRPRPPLDRSHVEGDPTSNATKQFAHLHHMKTGGTSINRVVSCAVDRARNGDRKALPFYSLSECGWGRYKQCTEGTDESATRCQDQINSSAVMQYCAPMFQMNRFGWLGESTDVITTLRNPVGRVWSMFRFQTRMCYHCTPLAEVYKMIDDGTIDDWCDEQRGSSGRGGGKPGGEKKGCDGVCMSQLLNHQTRNLMTTEWESPEGLAMSEQEKLDEALHNLQTNIAVVGITDELPAYRAILGEVFPWLAENVVLDPGADAAMVGKKGQKTCSLPHANASPRNNRCGQDGKSHWDLGDEPDRETMQAILKHNQLDMKLYEAAVKKFGLQKRALGLK